MSSLKQIDAFPEMDRLTKWRNERLEKADAEKQERLRIRAIEKQSDQEREKFQRLQAAKALLPNEVEIERQEQLLLSQNRQRSGRTFLQMLIFVMLPFAACAYYFIEVATPLYESRAVVAISKVATSNESQQAGLMNSLSASANLRETFMADAYIRSQTIEEELEGRAAIISRWEGDTIDPLQRLNGLKGLGLGGNQPLTPFLESHLDIQTGLLTVVVRDPDQEFATNASQLILDLTQTRLEQLSEEQYLQEISKADAAVEQAKLDLIDAQQALAQLQVKSGDVDPKQTVADVYATIRQLEEEALILEGEVQKAQIAGRGESFLASQTREMAELKRDEIEDRRQLLVNSRDGRDPLSTVLLDHERASLQVRIAEEALQSAFENLATTSRAAARNKGSLQIVVPPTASPVASAQDVLPKLMLTLVLCLTAFIFFRLIRAGARAY